jgi:hypothetical protein
MILDDVIPEGKRTSDILIPIRPTLRRDSIERTVQHNRLFCLRVDSDTDHFVGME